MKINVRFSFTIDETPSTVMKKWHTDVIKGKLVKLGVKRKNVRVYFVK